MRGRFVLTFAVLCEVLLALHVNVLAQAAKEPPAAPVPAAKPEDVKSLDAILSAVYDVISGPAGVRDWDRFRSLFIGDARLIPVAHKPDGTTTCQPMPTSGYVERAGAYFREHAFYEREISRKVESYGGVTHVFSTYESRETPDGKPLQRGINSFQLFYDGTRWWVVTIFWDAERPENPIPARYLEKK